MKFKRHKDITNLLNQFIKEKTKLTGINYFVSGGCLVDVDKKLETKDIDIYFNDEDSFLRLNEALKKLTEKKEGTGLFKKIISYSEVELVSETDNACTYVIEFNNHHYVIQLIRRIFGDFETVLSEFDIPLLKRYLTPDGMLHISSGYEPVLKNESKTITEASISRLIKYKNKGFELTTGAYLDLTNRILNQEFLSSYYSNEHVHSLGVVVRCLPKVLYSGFSIEEQAKIYSRTFDLIRYKYNDYGIAKDLVIEGKRVNISLDRFFFMKQALTLINEFHKINNLDYIKTLSLEFLAQIYSEMIKSEDPDIKWLMANLNSKNVFEEALIEYPEAIL